MEKYVPKYASKDYKGFDTFKADLKIANKTELEVGALISRQLDAKILEFNNDNKYDIKFQAKDGKIFTVEIKEDFTCARTGNIGVEYSCRGKDSGIAVSEADMYCYKAHQRDGSVVHLLMDTEILKKAILAQMYFRTVNGGDPGSNSLNYLFKYDVIKDISKTI